MAGVSGPDGARQRDQPGGGTARDGCTRAGGPGSVRQRDRPGEGEARDSTMGGWTRYRVNRLGRHVSMDRSGGVPFFLTRRGEWVRPGCTKGREGVARTDGAGVCVNGQGGMTGRGDGTSWDGRWVNRCVSANRSGEVLT